MRLVFLGSPPFATAVLERVLESRHRVLALVTRPDKPSGRGRSVHASPLAELARSREVPVLQPATAKDPSFVAGLKGLAPDLVLVASYGEILRREVLDLSPHGALNVHASLLPRHRGASPIQAAIQAGDRETGVSVQRMVLALDEGDVLLEERTPIGARETAGELLDRLADLGGRAAVRALDLVERGEARYRPQDPALATYARRIRKDDGRIDWSRPAAEVERHVRAMTPWPGARTKAPGGRDVVVHESSAVARPPDLPSPTPGTVLEARTRLLVAAGDGALEILSLTPSGGARMDGAAWLRGARIEPGSTFSSS